MSIVTETGAGLSTAETYASVSFCNTYHAALGNTDWDDLEQTDKEQALRKATIFMLASYRRRWQGGRVSSTQALDWPRLGVVVDGFAMLSTVVPADVAKACAELALRSATEDLLPDLDTGNNQIRRDKVGALETEYFQNNVDSRARFVAIDAMLAPYLAMSGGGASVQLVRA